MGKYDDIINLPHPVSKKHPQMPKADRAAQFMPFAALTGYGDAVTEAGRLTDAAPDLQEDVIEALNRKLTTLHAASGGHPEAEIVYFEKDAKKEGGAYRTIRGKIKKIDTDNGEIVMESGERIRIGDVVEAAGC